MEHPIRRYCRERKITQRAFANLVRLSDAYVSQLVNGVLPCGREAALKIVNATGGEVRLDELLTFPLRGERGGETAA